MSVTLELIHSPGCARCAEHREALRQTARSILGEALTWRDLNVLEHLDYAVSLGVLTLPALAINGYLVFPSLPTPEQLKRALEDPATGDSTGGR